MNTSFSPIPSFKPKLIHVACVRINKNGFLYLFLHQVEPYRFIWTIEEKPGVEIETAVWGETAQEALLTAYKVWRNDEISPLNCGFRYTLPERDEVGTNAFFHQMAASYSSPSGVYFDEELGANCIIQFASLEARNLWARLRSSTPL